MRWMMCWLAGTIFLLCSGMTCCGVGGPELVALSADDECTYFDCPLALGGEVVVDLWEYAQPGDITDAKLDRPDLASLKLDGGRLVLGPRVAGDGWLCVTIDGDTVLERWIETAAVASTSVVADRNIEGLHHVYPPGRKQMYAGSTLRVFAEHRDAGGSRLLGHGFEAWTINGGTLAEPMAAPGATLDTALVRDLTATGPSLVTVSAGPRSTPLELDVVAAGSAATLELRYKTSRVRFGEVSLISNELVSVPVNVYSADGRYIHGTPTGGALTVEVADPSVVSIVPDDSRRALRFEGLAPGTTGLAVHFDGATAHFTVNVR